MVAAGALLLAYGITRRAPREKLLVLVSMPLLYRGVTGRWPMEPPVANALSGRRGVHVREAVRLERPIAEVYGFWRDLANLPRFMAHLESVCEEGFRSRWVALGPAGTRVQWDAELINDEPRKVIGWRSLPGSDITTAGSVNFDEVRKGATQVTVHLQYAAPAGKAGAAVAALFGREPSQMIREDLRRFKQLLEAGELAQAAPLVNGARP